MNYDNNYEANPMAGMSMGGPMISGKWYNKRTGESVIVRDAVMSDQGMDVITSTREMIPGDIFSRDYIQVSDEVYDEKGNSTGVKEEADYSEMFQGADPIPTALDKPLTVFVGAKGATKPGPEITGKSASESKKVSESYALLDKLFGKVKTTPEINVEIRWDDAPKDALNMLMTIYDISKEDIADYLAKNYFDAESMKRSIEAAVDSIL